MIVCSFDMFVGVCVWVCVGGGVWGCVCVCLFLFFVCLFFVCFFFLFNFICLDFFHAVFVLK